MVAGSSRDQPQISTLSCLWFQIDLKVSKFFDIHLEYYVITETRNPQHESTQGSGVNKRRLKEQRNFSRFSVLLKFHRQGAKMHQCECERLITYVMLVMKHKPA